MWAESAVRISLQREARLAMDKMVRGVNGTYGIREAADIASPAIGATDTQIDFVGLDANTRSFYLGAGNRIRYINESAGDSVIQDGNVQTLTFDRKSETRVEIDLSMTEDLRGKEIRVDLSTQVRLRN